MPLYKLTLAYDGTAYRGWQIQPEGDTIQDHIQRALSLMAKTKTTVIAAGRTDAGVHAHGQVAHFRIEHAIPADGILRGLNAMLPRDIRIFRVEEARADFHARFDARSKTYRYYLNRSQVPLPFRCRYTLHYPHALDRQAMDEAARSFLGEHDFRAFRASSCSAKTTTRRVLVSQWVDEEEELWFEVAATGFLQHMIRNMVGTLLEVGRGKRPPASIADLLLRGDRREAGPTAPPQGLHLMHVEYP